MSQNHFTTGSVIFATTLLLYISLVNIRGIEIRVVFGYSKSAKIVFLRVCSSLGHQLSQNIFLNIPTSPDAIRGLCSGEIHSSILNAIGQSLSEGSKIIVWLVRDFGIFPIIASARSPCGSITATHLPFLISSKIIFSRRVDFHIQVFQIIYICLLLSFGPIQKACSSPLKFVFQIGVRSFSRSCEVKRGRFTGGSKLRDNTQLIFGVCTLVVGR